MIVGQNYSMNFSILKMPLPCIEAPTSDINAAARVIWGDAYFENCFESKDYERACDALKGRFVSKRCFEEKLETIFYAGQVAPFETYISKLATQANEPSNCLLASAALALYNHTCILSKQVEPIKHIYDANSYIAVLTAFLIGCAEASSDEAVICSHTKKVYDLPTDSNETEVKQITWLVRLASLLGKYHMRPTNMSSEALIRHVKWFLTTKLRRPFDYSKAHRFLLFILLKSNIGLKLLKTYDLAADLEYCWRDENGNIVLRFERIASPIREAMHEKYYRQPILFRWLCNSEWLKETLCKHNLHLRYVSRLESIP